MDPLDKNTERMLALLTQAQQTYSDEYLLVAVPGFLSRKFIGYCSMRDDLIRASEYIKLLRSKPDQIIESALAYSLISLYGKCFTDASRSSSPKLEAASLFTAGESNYDTHIYIMELRHNFIAHRGETDSEVGVAFMLVPKKDDPDKSQIRFSQLKQISFSEKDLDRIESLILFLLDILMEKIKKVGQKVHDDMLKLFTPNQLALMMINNAKL